MKKKKTGRPSKFDSINLKQVQRLVIKGFTDKEIADFLEINEDTLHEWKKKHPDFSESLKDWKIEADTKVERSLYDRALGFDYDEVTYEKSNVGGMGIKLKDGEIQALKHTDTYKTKIVTKKVLGDVTAQIFWLKNRKPKDWRDKVIGLMGDADDDEFCDEFFGFKRKNKSKNDA